jgi:hypothetical protein
VALIIEWGKRDSGGEYILLSIEIAHLSTRKTNSESTRIHHSCTVVFMQDRIVHIRRARQFRIGGILAYRKRDLPSRLTGKGIAALSPKHRKKEQLDTRTREIPGGETHRIACLLNADMSDISMWAVRRSRPRNGYLHERGVVGICFVSVCWEKSVLKVPTSQATKRNSFFHVWRDLSSLNSKRQFPFRARPG